ncbi:hypothetical protein AH2_00027 [Burkholderia phage vB_BceS_AH2]|uniref:Uncharacterized protein n=1 Tax=Burkholderia phage vB_BceS_AH2 TaxID=1133022 RepID=I6NSF8_9CAUD|nr:hypothetical protein B613_gp27 [Burkholderia phage vB_BceS_AH2]AEY69537.1 hypothetical protein AH2_00027 [Burkholderia phage vB_BceS_AH2]
MDKEIEDLVFKFGSAMRTAFGDGRCVRDLPEFKALDARITDVLTEATQRGVQAERNRWIGRGVAVGGEIGADGKKIAGTVQVRIVRGYTKLFDVLIEALNEAQDGKGSERHTLGGDVPFERQRMQTVSELIGSPDGMVFQAVKKITEGMALPTLDRQVKELLGAINYLAGCIIYLRKNWLEHEIDAASQDGREIAEQRAREIEALSATRWSRLCMGQSWAEPCKWQAPDIKTKAATDPVQRDYPIVADVGWAAQNVNDLFAVLYKLNVKLCRAEASDDEVAAARQLLARVWRFNSPILKAISALAEEIDGVASLDAGRPNIPQPQPGRRR